MRRHFVWSEGFGVKGVPWLSVANASAEPMTVNIAIRTDAGKVHNETATIGPISRYAWALADIIEKSHFMAHVIIDKLGAATLVIWEQSYQFPPYTPPVSIYDEAIGLRLTAEQPQPK